MMPYTRIQAAPSDEALHFHGHLLPQLGELNWGAEENKVHTFIFDLRNKYFRTFLSNRSFLNISNIKRVATFSKLVLE
jgi:hypothetical protein